MGKKADRRVRYTKAELKNSLVKKLKEKPIEAISVKELCEEADINRSTFYSHYPDIFALMRELSDEVIESIEEHLKKIDFDNEEMKVETVEAILNFLVLDVDLVSVLIGKNGDPSLQDAIMSMVMRHTISWIKGKGNGKDLLIEYYINFLVNGSLSVIQKWLDEGMRIEAKDIAMLISNMASQTKITI
ncbi:MAG: TetR/AcrR family transcriptional regulator [Ruminococcaceae bacterium]|nr:TetR/AcrR family transcriptional regulator [Oscillospiraceae bacterium]